MRTCCLTALMIAANFAVAGEQCSEAQKIAGQRIYLMGVGVDWYARTGGFESSEKEVHALVAALATKMCVPGSQITEIVRSTPPNRANIIIAYASALKRMKPGQTLVFIYAGHGFSIDGVFYIVPQDAYLDEKSLEASRAASISLSSLIEIEREYVRDVLFLLDGCRTFPIRLAGATSTVLFSTQEGEPSYEVKGHGLFLPKITSSLQAAGPLTLGDLPALAHHATASVETAGVGQRSALIVDVPPNLSAGLIRDAKLAESDTVVPTELMLGRAGSTISAIRRLAWPEALNPIF